MNDIIPSIAVLLYCLVVCGVPILGVGILIYLLTRGNKPKAQPESKVKALPDVLTLLELAKQKGVSMEELLEELQTENNAKPKAVAHPAAAEEKAASSQQVLPARQESPGSSTLLAQVLLYFGSAIFLTAVIVLVTFEWEIVHPAFKLLTLVLTTLGFYGTGMLMYRNRQFKSTGLAFTVIGLATALFSGLGLWNFGLKDIFLNAGIGFDVYWAMFSVLVHPLILLTYWFVRTPGFLKIYLFFAYLLNFAIAAALSTDLRFRVVVFAVLNLALYVTAKQIAARHSFLSTTSSAMNQLLDAIIVLVAAFNLLNHDKADITAQIVVGVSLLIPTIFDAITAYYDRKNTTLVNLLTIKAIVLLPVKLFIILLYLGVSASEAMFAWSIYILCAGVIIRRLSTEKFVYGAQYFVSLAIRFLVTVAIAGAITVSEYRSLPAAQLAVFALLMGGVLHWLQNRKSMLENLTFIFFPAWLSMLVYAFMPADGWLVPAYVSATLVAVAAGYNLFNPDSKNLLRAPAIGLVAGALVINFTTFFVYVERPHHGIAFTTLFSLILLARYTFSLQGVLGVFTKIGEFFLVLAQLISFYFSFAAGVQGIWPSWIMLVAVLLYWGILMALIKPRGEKQPYDLFAPSYGFALSSLGMLAASQSDLNTLVSMGIVLTFLCVLMAVKRIGTLAGLIYLVFAMWSINAFVVLDWRDGFSTLIIALTAGAFAIYWLVERALANKAPNAMLKYVRHSMFTAAVLFQTTTLALLGAALSSNQLQDALPFAFAFIGLLAIRNRFVRDWAFVGFVPVLCWLLFNFAGIEFFADASANLFFAIPALYLLSISAVNFLRKDIVWAKLLELAGYGMWASLSLLQTIWLLDLERLVLGFVVIVVSVAFAARSAMSGRLHWPLFLLAAFTLALELLVLFYAVLFAIPWWIYLGLFGLLILVIAVWLVYRAAKKS